MPKVPPSPQETSFPPITATDRPWVENADCQWPTPHDEEQWLTQFNTFIRLGSRMLGTSTADDIARTTTARQTVIGMLPRLRQDLTDVVATHSQRLEHGTPTSNLITILRWMHAHNLDGIHAVNQAPGLTCFSSSDNLQVNYDLLCTIHGEEKARQILHKAPNTHSYSPSRLEGTLQLLIEAGRLWGWGEQAGSAARKILENSPRLYSYSHTRLRVLGSIITHQLAPFPFKEATITNITYITIPQPVYVAAAAIETDPKQIHVLRQQTRRYSEHMAPQAALGVIALHPDHRISEIYLEGYPQTTEDLEAAERAYRKYLNTSGAIGEEIGTFWSGRAQLGDPSLSAFRAFGRALEGIPPFTQEELSEINTIIVRGMDAQVRLQLASHQGTAVSAEDEQERDLWLDARKALIVRHLRLVYELAKRYAHTDNYRSELLGIGSEALAIAAEEFNPRQHEDFATYAATRIDAAYARMPKQESKVKAKQLLQTHDR